VNPQIFYLKQDRNDGYYFNSTFTIAKSNFPLSLSSIINRSIRTIMPGSKEFVGNVSLVYSFSRNYIPKALAP
jgi:hypothetical protein